MRAYIEFDDSMQYPAGVTVENDSKIIILKTWPSRVRARLEDYCVEVTSVDVYRRMRSLTGHEGRVEHHLRRNREGRRG